MFEYFIIAFSFALSSYFFIHRKGTKRKIPIRYDIAYLIIATVLFPILFISWIVDVDNWTNSYGKTLNDLIDKERNK